MALLATVVRAVLMMWLVGCVLVILRSGFTFYITMFTVCHGDRICTLHSVSTNVLMLFLMQGFLTISEVLTLGFVAISLHIGHGGLTREGERGGKRRGGEALTRKEGSEHQQERW